MADVTSASTNSDVELYPTLAEDERIPATRDMMLRLLEASDGRYGPYWPDTVWACDRTLESIKPIVAHYYADPRVASCTNLRVVLKSNNMVPFGELWVFDFESQRLKPCSDCKGFEAFVPAVGVVTRA